MRSTECSGRDPLLTYHMLKREQLDALTPGFDWTAYFTAVGAPPVGKIDVTEEEGCPRRGQAGRARGTTLDDLKTYLKMASSSSGAAGLAAQGLRRREFRVRGQAADRHDREPAALEARAYMIDGRARW